MSESASRRVLVIFGTRPEVIKLAPVIRELARRQSDFALTTCSTGQHRGMLQQALDAFALKPDIRLDAMAAGQSLAGLTARLFTDLDAVIARERPDWVVVQGDTTSAFVGAVTAFYRRVSVAHVEAGLRTGNRWAPFPEESNRAMIARVADLHFAPTQRAAAQLLSEGVAPESVHVTGNTVVDALLSVLSQMGDSAPPGIGQKILDFVAGKRLVLVTSHRRESYGGPIQDICRALVDIVEAHQDVVVAYPVHLNPSIREPVHRLLGNHPKILLLEPLGYLPLLWMMRQSSFILTDSGGIQEEAPSIGKRVLVMRDTTERPEVIDAGWGVLVGTNRERITAEAGLLLGSGSAPAMPDSPNPFGDGTAARQIVALISRKGVGASRPPVA